MAFQSFWFQKERVYDRLPCFQNQIFDTKSKKTHFSTGDFNGIFWTKVHPTKILLSSLKKNTSDMWNFSATPIGCTSQPVKGTRIITCLVGNPPNRPYLPVASWVGGRSNTHPIFILQASVQLDIYRSLHNDHHLLDKVQQQKKGCWRFTLPETHTRKMDGWKMNFPFGMAQFQGQTVSFREGRWFSPA